MSRLLSRLLFPRTGVHMNMSMELAASRSLLNESKLLTATIAAASYSSLRALGLLAELNSEPHGSFDDRKCTVLEANADISDSAAENKQKKEHYLD